MARVLIPSSPIYGHVTPMLAIGRALVARGHHVTMLTGRKYRAAADAAGLDVRLLPPEVDYDDADLDAWLPGRADRRGLDAVRHDLIGMFARTIPAQHRALTSALATGQFDVVLAESAFTGVLPTLLTVPREERVPVLGVSALPVTLTSVDTAPFGLGLHPGHGPLARLRNRALHRLLHAGPLRAVQEATDAALAEVGSPPQPGTFFDVAACFDHTFQLSVPGLEYPRRELPGTVELVGPLRPSARPAAAANLPGWWADVEELRPVVHVTQGTIDNLDLGRLVVPTVRALAEEEVLVVVSTGGRPVSAVRDALGGPLPANVRVAEWLPYAQLLPHTAAVVTNGGFGGVLAALAHGVPLVVAGATEDKPEVAARVAWAGVGVDLRTGRPRPARVRRAVRQVLDDDGYWRAARRLRAEIAAGGDPVDAIDAVLRRPPVPSRADLRATPPAATPLLAGCAVDR